MARQIAVVVEHWKGHVTPITYELLALGRELADQALARLVAVLPGHNARDMARSLGAADSVLYLDHPALADPLPELCAEVLASALGGRSLECVLCPITPISVGIGALIGERLGLPSVALCRDVRLGVTSYEATCLLYGGKLEAEVSVEAKPAVFSVWPGARPAQSGHFERPPLIEDGPVHLTSLHPVRLKNYLEPQPGDVDISATEVLVAVGRGMQGPENLPLAQRLASALGGAVCGSRPAVDQGWLPLSRQVGCSGLTVRPRLYLTLGISGAPEHVEGMRDSQLIVAVNSDPQAPIFHHAHYGVVADAIKLVPLLADCLAPVGRASPSSARPSSPG